MPNRILKDWTDSKTVNEISWQQEVLFTRLIMKADDYGNFHRDPATVRSLCFPRKDRLKTPDVEAWLKSLELAGLITCYHAKGDIFLHIFNFGQRLDKRKRKFPPEPDDLANNQNLRENIFPENPGKNITETKRNETNKKRNEDARGAFIIPFSSDGFLGTWEILKRQPKWEKKSRDALQMALKKLGDHSESDAIAIMQNAIAGGWQGLYPLDKTKKENGIKQNRKANQYTPEEYGSAIRSVFGGSPPGAENDPGINHAIPADEPHQSRTG